MKLRRLTISRLPGIDAPFTVEGLSDGINVIVGPNGIGKSSLCRALRHLIWPKESSRQSTSARALFEDDQGQWWVQADGQPPRWQLNGLDTAPPLLPADHLDRCFFLRLPDLIESTDNAGHDVAVAIRRQMAGGFDLDELTAEISAKVGTRPGRSKRKKLSDIQSEIRKAEASQADLSAKESRLDELAGQIVAADEAQQRLPRVEGAIGLQAHRDELAAVEAALEPMPSELRNMAGDELKTLESIEADLQAKSDQKRKAESTRDKAIADATASGLKARVPAPDLSTARASADSLADLERNLDQAKTDHRGKARALAEARRACGGNADAPETLDLPAASKLFAFFRERDSASTRLRAIDKQFEILNQAIPLEHDPNQSELLGRGVASLRAWLSTPVVSESQQESTLWPPRMWMFFLAGVLVVLGVALGVVLHLAFLAVAGLGVGLGIAGWVFRIDTIVQSGEGDARGVHERDFPTNLAAPDAWSLESVTARLRDLERDLAANIAASRQSGYRDADRAKLKVEREEVVEEQRESDQQRQALAHTLGLQEIPPDAELVDMVRALDELRIKIQDEQGAAGEIEELERQRSQVFEKLVAMLDRHDEESLARGASPRAAVESLAARDQALSNAKVAQQHAQEQLVQLGNDLSALETSKRAIYTQAGLQVDDRSGLVRLLEVIKPYKENVAQKDGLSKAITTLESNLRSAGADDVLGLDHSQLETERGRLAARVAGGQTLRSEESDIKSDVKKARESNDLEALISKRDEAREVLSDRRDGVMASAAGKFLVGSVQEEYELNQMPRVLERARTFFGDFTHHSYELQVPQNDQASFVAVDAVTGRGHKPSELSDGSRAQLLLASRLAFVDEAEHGVRLPLFLDEALDQSDPPRYQSIVRCLGRIAADDDRQIFYLTNDPTDLARIQEALAQEGCGPPHVIDLAVVRERESSVKSADELNVELLPKIPAPATLTPEQYGAELSVPRFDPGRGHHAQHLIYMLWDDLQTLHTLLDGRIDRVGKWLALAAAGAPLAQSVLTGDGAGSQLDARSQLLEAFCEAYSEGRGRAVDSEAIERSAAVTSVFLSDVVDVCRELDGDGESLIRTLRAREDSRLKGFRSNAIDALSTYFIEADYIDPRPVLGESDVLTRVLASPAPARLPGEVPGNFVHRWWRLSSGTDT